MTIIAQHMFLSHFAVNKSHTKKKAHSHTLSHNLNGICGHIINTIYFKMKVVILNKLILKHMFIFNRISGNHYSKICLIM